MRTKIGSYVVDLLTPSEHKDNLNKLFERYLIERYRGESYLQFTGVSSGSVVQIPGPNSGYVWSVKLLSIVCDQTSVGLNVYLGENTNTAPIYTGGNGLSNAVVTLFTSNTFIHQDERPITVTSSTGNITAWRLHVKQVPGEMIGKL